MKTIVDCRMRIAEIKKKIKSQNSKFQSAIRNPQSEIRNPKSLQSGMVLIFVLIMVAVLSALTINLSTKMNQEISLLQNSVDELKASALTQAGINYGVAILKMDKELEVDWLGEDWAKEDAPDNVGTELTFDEGTVKINIEDEAEKINLNNLTIGNTGEKTSRIEQMMKLCDNTNLEYSIVPAIIDWIDADEEITVLSTETGDIEGAENDYYAELPLPYPCKNAPFDTIEEVIMVKGITKENYYGENGLENFVTVFTDGKININTADKKVLKSTLQASISSSEGETVTDDVIADIMDQRIEKPFGEPSDLKDFFHGKTLNTGLLDVKSSVFTITSKAKVGKIDKTITALVERKQASIEVKFWKEN